MEVFTYYLINIVVPVLVLFFLALVVVLAVNRLNYEIFKFRSRLAKAKIDIFLTSLVFSPLDKDDFTLHIDNFKKRIPFEKNWCKEIILNEIINLKQNLKGEIGQNIHFIYEQFHLFNFSLKYLKSYQWYKKSIGIYHFQALEYSKGEKYVRPYLNHKNSILSANAYMALVSLTSDKLDFLVDFANPISLTTEIKIMDILHTKKAPMPQNLKDWIHSDNPSIVKLGIKFMVYYNYTNEAAEILKLLNSDNHIIRYEVILAAKELFIEGAEESLIAQFDIEDKKNKIEILNTLGSMGTAVTENFLSVQLMRPIETDIKLAIVQSLNAINGNYFNEVFKDDNEIMKMVEHVKDPYI